MGCALSWQHLPGSRAVGLSSRRSQTVMQLQQRSQAVPWWVLELLWLFKFITNGSKGRFFLLASNFGQRLPHGWRRGWGSLLWLKAIPGKEFHLWTLSCKYTNSWRNKFLGLEGGFGQHTPLSTRRCKFAKDEVREVSTYQVIQGLINHTYRLGHCFKKQWEAGKRS